MPDLARLRALSASMPRPEPDPLLVGLRCALDPAFAAAVDRSDAIRSGRRSWDGLTADSVRRQAGRGRYGNRYQCADCHRIGLPSAESRCPSCGYSHGAPNHYAVPVR